MSQALYRTYRPQGWQEVVGQEHVVQTLRNALQAGRIAHAYLFAGPRGTGKTTLARLLAKAVNCLDPDPAARPCDRCENCLAVREGRFLDLIEIDAASNTSVEDVRDLRDKVNFAPSQGKYKVYIIDEVHMLSTAAFNALLKTLEEPPSHVIFVLATTEIHKIPATVLSRCQRHEFRRLSVAEIVGQLERIAEKEALQAEAEALTLIARQASGSLRDAISLLDQVASAGLPITLALVQTLLGTAAPTSVPELIESLHGGDASRALGIIHRALDGGADARAFARQIVDHLRSLLLIQFGNETEIDATPEMKAQMRKQARYFTTATLLSLIKAFHSAAVDTRNAWLPSLGLELAVAEALNAISGEPQQSPKTAHSPASAARQPVPPDSVKAPGPKVEAAQHSGASPSPADRPPVLSLEEVQRVWPEVRKRLKPGHPSTDGLLNSCRPMEIRGHDLILGFKSEIVRALMDRPEHIEPTRKVLKEMLGVELSIRCVVVNAQGKLPPHIPANSMVAEALNQGGKLVEEE
uniref:DNA polymerase III subunit gamma/tau n=1 Tax=uncultured Chloroflexota bacterium TaxID=166587 RepID=H5SK86_9CHLR|nr:DNA polymerase III subunits gamma and tau [uncultured bacterium]BAL56572.1 DNA polymerase III subunit gamma/tau [uncultured Chloroflexota bacterium]